MLDVFTYPLGYRYPRLMTTALGHYRIWYEVNEVAVHTFASPTTHKNNIQNCVRQPTHIIIVLKSCTVGCIGSTTVGGYLMT
jgi:hypothetical protein